MTIIKQQDHTSPCDLDKCMMLTGQIVLLYTKGYTTKLLKSKLVVLSLVKATTPTNLYDVIIT